MNLDGVPIPPQGEQFTSRKALADHLAPLLGKSSTAIQKALSRYDGDVQRVIASEAPGRAYAPPRIPSADPAPETVAMLSVTRDGWRRPMARPIGERAMTGAERQARYRAAHAPGLHAPLWRADDKAETVAMRIWAQLSLGKARLGHTELGKLIRQCEDIRRDAMQRGRR
jgi:hypothetical protein